MPIQRKSALKNSRVWDEKSSSQTQRGANDQMENPFNNVIDNWSKEMALKTMEGKNKKLDLAKSQSELDIRNTKHAEIVASVPSDMTKSGII
jgi:hypothetical protein